MPSQANFKICGLTRPDDARVAAESGASYLGFIFHVGSPRCVSLEGYAALRGQLPAVAKVAVAVTPSAEALETLEAAGFDYFQIHFPGGDFESARRWSEQLGRSRLWLAPKIAPGETFDLRLLQLADTILWDGYKADGFGGTGKRSDWEQFARLRVAHPGVRWILAGGLAPETADEAVAATGAQWLDFNSGVEKEPGVKDQSRVREVGKRLRGHGD